jgi:hypothetical protein
MNVANSPEFDETAYRPLNEIVTSDAPPKGFSGEVLCHDISEIIRSLTLAKFDIALVVKNGPRDGKVIFKDGEIVASICGDLRGSKALSKIRSWKKGCFTLLRIFDGTVCRDE